ncbi:hypothetical protein [Nakamurella endophytica]|uniref:Uncharacterized protein n=1 Tax=Nakamurella endophytica TaxID=1748367 RepID=A0A917WF76_9ACTN|nr:hypothetical protein [Nakamurella endophytica]GGL97475.1 hypothetical protein GCM10011594_16620 [Nakamurella endophytica]
MTSTTPEPGDGAVSHTLYRRPRGAGLLVLTLDGDRIAALTRFDSDVLARFGLPSSLPPRRAADGTGVP